MFDFRHVKLWTAVVKLLKIKVYKKAFYLIYQITYFTHTHFLKEDRAQ